MDATRWTAEHVESLAPDAASVAAGRRLAHPAGWSGEGCDGRAVWGLAQGSGKSPYRTVVDLRDPAYHCSCPSRKLPCKHSLGLLLRWSGGEVPEGVASPDFATAWLAARAERADTAVERAPAPAASAGALADPEAAARRVAQRAERVTAGLDELDRWLADQVRTGVAGLPAKGYAAFEPMAARLVDAQAPGVAGRVRGLPGAVTGGTDWPQRLLEELGLLRLLCRAHARLPEIEAADPGLAASIRTHVGYPVSKDSVLALPGVEDRWAVHALRDEVVPSSSLTQRIVWLEGEATGRMATVLSYAGPGQSLDASLVPGRTVLGPLHFYPAAHPVRALVGEPHRDDGSAAPPRPGTVEQALAGVADALAADPWARAIPAWVLGAPVRTGAAWVLRDELGDALPLRGDDHWALVATCGGRPSAVLVEWTPAAWVPVTAVTRWQGLAA